MVLYSLVCSLSHCTHAHARTHSMSQVDELQSTKKDLENTVISLRNQVEVRARTVWLSGVVFQILYFPRR